MGQAEAQRAKSEKADPKRVGLFLLNSKVSSLLLDHLIFDVTQKGNFLPYQQSAFLPPLLHSQSLP